MIGPGAIQSSVHRPAAFRRWRRRNPGVPLQRQCSEYPIRFAEAAAAPCERNSFSLPEQGRERSMLVIMLRPLDDGTLV